MSSKSVDKSSKPRLCEQASKIKTQNQLIWIETENEPKSETNFSVNHIAHSKWETTEVEHWKILLAAIATFFPLFVFFFCLCVCVFNFNMAHEFSNKYTRICISCDRIERRERGGKYIHRWLFDFLFERCVRKRARLRHLAFHLNYVICVNSYWCAWVQLGIYVIWRQQKACDTEDLCSWPCAVNKNPATIFSDRDLLNIKFFSWDAMSKSPNFCYAKRLVSVSIHPIVHSWSNAGKKTPHFVCPSHTEWMLNSNYTNSHEILIDHNRSHQHTFPTHISSVWWQENRRTRSHARRLRHLIAKNNSGINMNEISMPFLLHLFILWRPPS